MAGRGNVISREKQKQIVNLAIEGKSLSEIEEITGCGLTTIKKYLKLFGISLSKIQKEKRRMFYKELASLYKKGYTLNQIADEYGLKVYQVKYAIKKVTRKRRKKKNHHQS